MTIQIENVSDKDIAFSARYYFYLKTKTDDAASRNYGRLGDSYWSPAGIVDEKGQLVVVPHGFKTAKRGERLSYRFPNDLVRLRNGESKQIKVDLAQFPWNDRILSGWPAGDHFNYVPKGAYLLEFKISTDRDDVASNQETVSLD